MNEKKKVFTYRTKMKKLILDLRYAQMRVRMELHGIERSKEAVIRIAQQMKQLQKEKREEYGYN